MDVTSVFHGAVRQRCGTDLEFESAIANKRVVIPCGFVATANEIARNIAHISSFLASNQRSYVDQHGDVDRARFDGECQSLMAMCEERIETLKVMVAVESQVQCTIIHGEDKQTYMKTSAQCKAQHLGVVGVLFDRLSSLVERSNELRTHHLNQIMQVHNHRVLVGRAHDKLDAKTQAKLDELQRAAQGDDGGHDFDDDGYGSAEAVAQEQEELFHQFEAMNDHIQEAESKIHEIAALSTMLNTKLANQASEIEQLYEDTVAIADNVSKGNETLAKTNAHSVDYRTWVLFVLITASLSLLFLDWYEP